jgi:hypothetical protein
MFVYESFSSDVWWGPNVTVNSDFQVPIENLVINADPLPAGLEADLQNTDVVIPEIVATSVYSDLLPIVPPNDPRPWRIVSLDNLLRDLEENVDDNYSGGEWSPIHSFVTSLGDDNVEILSTSGLDSDIDVFIYCCDRYRPLFEACSVCIEFHYCKKYYYVLLEPLTS